MIHCVQNDYQVAQILSRNYDQYACVQNDTVSQCEEGSYDAVFRPKEKRRDYGTHRQQSVHERSMMQQKGGGGMRGE